MKTHRDGGGGGGGGETESESERQMLKRDMKDIVRKAERGMA